MESYLNHLQAVINRLPVESFADATLQWMDSYQLLENPSTVIFSGFNEASIDAVKQLVSRAVGAYFFYPRVSSPFALINASVGIVHLGVGFTQRFRTTERPSEAPHVWNQVALNVHKGFAHLLVAGYDFGIGYLLKQKYLYVNLIAVLAFSAFPVLTAIYHQKVYRKPETPSINAQSEEERIRGVLNLAKQHLDGPVFQTLASKFPKIKLDPAPTTPPAEPEKVIPIYLASDCWIYIIAKRITLELMPAIEPPPEEGLMKKTVKIVRRISGIGLPEVGEAPLPNYGL